MKKNYAPHEIESQCTARWEAESISEPTRTAQASYCIPLPPPNVTGTLHMGHGFQHTLMDALIRQHRMDGFNTLWQPGTDHAGIATQMVVERQLAKENITPQDLGREQFIDKVWTWKKHSGGIITEQIKRLGASIDWSRNRFSMDPDITHATYTAFKTLHSQGLIYKGKRLVNWDPVLKTAIADLEVESIETKGHLYHIQYPVADSADMITIATTRPETLLGDSAIAVHPDDERYQALIGQAVMLPLCDRRIPIIADPSVDPTFGTGCLKITPGHDFNDYLVGQRHSLPIHNILTEAAHLNEEVPAPYRGLSVTDARTQIIDDLTALNLLITIDPHTHMVPHGDRSGAVIEPMLTDQWFVNARALAERAMEVVRTGEVQFVPQHWEKTYFQWLEQIEDWCISRQLWWGHRIPAWYDADGQCYIGETEAAVRAEYQLPSDLALKQDEDVLDTWFTAALWPFSSLGWPEKTPDFSQFYPTNVLVTGFDIIFFWVARMIMMGLALTDQVPFKTVYITGLIRDHLGQKMSKSKGNIIDPIDLIDGISLSALIEKRTQGLMQPQMANKIKQLTQRTFPDGITSYGTDALRMTFCSLATTGRDIHFDMSRIEGYRYFCNKLWNASRYVLGQTQDLAHPLNQAPAHPVNQWIIDLLNDTIKTVRAHFSDYRFDLITHTLYEFTWHNLCDWYLELSKSLLNDPSLSDALKAETQGTLRYVLNTVLQLLHPITPFITESIWEMSRFEPTDTPLIANAPYPTPQWVSTETTENPIHWVRAVISAIRQLRSQFRIPPGKRIPLLLSQGNPSDQAHSQAYARLITELAKTELPIWKETANDLPAASQAMIGSLRLSIPLAGLIDPEAESARLKKQIEKDTQTAEKINKKLNQAGFINKAPAAVIEKEKQTHAGIMATIAALTEQQALMETLRAENQSE